MEVLEFAGGETLLGGELRASIDLDGAHSQREAARSGWPRSWRRGGDGTAVELHHIHHIRARDHVARGAAERVWCERADTYKASVLLPSPGLGARDCQSQGLMPGPTTPPADRARRSPLVISPEIRPGAWRTNGDSPCVCRALSGIRNLWAVRREKLGRNPSISSPGRGARPGDCLHPSDAARTPAGRQRLRQDALRSREIRGVQATVRRAPIATPLEVRN
jgi:hypothetical protein